MNSIRRKVVLLLVTALLASAPSWAAPWSLKADFSSPLDLLSRLWGTLTSVWSETGCHIDPHGGCASSETPPADQVDTGCQIDPNGCPAAQAEQPSADEVDEGCQIDPNGGCRS